MIRIMITMGLLLLVNIVRGQPHVCLQKDQATNHTEFRSTELDNFLHLDKFNIVFFGEHHNTDFDPEIKYYLITDLYKRSGIRHVFMETSVSRAWHYNQYLRTGDTSHLDISSSPYAYSGYLLFWKKLYDFNQDLPKDSKIMIYGVDFETTAVFRTLKQLASPKEDIPFSLRQIMDTIDAHILDKPLHMWDIIDNKFILYDNSSFDRTLRFIQAQLLANDADVKSYFRDNYAIVHNIAVNTGKVEVKAKNRNKTMFAAIKRAMLEDSIKKFIGFFGSQHTDNSIHSALPNSVRKIRGVRGDEILTIAEFAYNTNSKITAFRPKHFGDIISLNRDCRASLHLSSAVPGFSNKCDFVFIANIKE